MTLDRALELARNGRAEAESELFEELRIASVSTDPDRAGDVRRNCDWLAQRLGALGFAVRVTDVMAGGHPVLQADWSGAGPAAPTVTVYGHYDVQPPDPLEEWVSPPFEPTVRDGAVFARGSADNKGNHMAALMAARWAIAAGGPPVNLRFLIEGEEEITGESLPRYVGERAAELGGDGILVWDGGFSADGGPELVTALRGIVYVELLASGAAVDLHSGGFGGVAPNPLNTLALIIAGLKDRDGRILVPGFYDGVRVPTAAEAADWDRSAEFGETLRRLMGATAIEGESEYSPADRIWARPTLDVNGLVGGFTGEGKKTVIPARAMAKVSMRLVPGQQPERVLEALRARVAELATPGVAVEVRLLGSAPPVEAPADHAVAVALARGFELAFGQTAKRLRTGGSIPVAADFQTHLGTPMVISGIAQPGAAAHSPNEHLSLRHYHAGIEALIRFYWEMAAARAGGA